MLAYAARRLAALPLTLFIIVTLAFVVVRTAPGGPFDAEQSLPPQVKANLEHRIESMGQRPRFRRVVVPTEQVIETKDGQKVQAEKRTLPGYVLVNMDLNDDAWTVVKNTAVPATFAPSNSARACAAV